MTISRVLVLTGLTLFSAGWLMADALPDGHLGLKSGGCCSIDVFGLGPVDFGDDGVVNANGGGSFVLNNQTAHVIKKFEVTIEFTDFDQVFVCESALFLFCDISGSGEPDPDIGSPHGVVTFLFHGIGAGDAAFNSCAPDNTFNCLDDGSASDSDPGGINGSGDFILDLNDPCPLTISCDAVGGFAPGTKITARIPDGGLGDPIVPEPGTFAMLLTAGGVLLAGRKFRRQ